MNVLNQLNARFNEEWGALSKQILQVGTDAASETAGAAAEALRVLAKQLGTLGDRIEKWGASTRISTDSATKEAAGTPPPEAAEAEVATTTAPSTKPAKEASSVAAEAPKASGRHGEKTSKKK